MNVPFIAYLFDFSITNTIQNNPNHKETGIIIKRREKIGRFYPNDHLNKHACLKTGNFGILHTQKSIFLKKSGFKRMSEMVLLLNKTQNGDNFTIVLGV